MTRDHMIIRLSKKIQIDTSPGNELLYENVVVLTVIIT